MDDRESHKYKYIGKKYSSYKVIGIADFNGNGRDDILWEKDKYYSIWDINTNGSHQYKYIGKKYFPYTALSNENLKYNERNKEKIEYQGGSIYTGEWKESQKRDGYGKMIWHYTNAKDTIYYGYWKNNKRDNYGVINYSWGDKYTGDWKNDQKSGYGIMVYNGGTKYKGFWKNDAKNGHGIIEYYFGDKYEGDWKDNKREGNGTYYYKSGSIYKGEWKNNKKEGTGSLISQYGTYSGIWQNNDLIEITNQDSYEEAYDYLNKIRNQAGMIKLKRNIILERTAQSHSDYIIIHDKELKELSYHKEIKGKEGFTGITVGDRANYQGYFSTSIGEGISHRKTAKMSINSLMTAIYHRFGILSFIKNEIGIGFTQESDIMIRNFVHNSGNSILNQLCQTDSYTSGIYYYNVCKDHDHRIGKELFENAKSNIQKLNPKYVLWPPKDSIDNLYKFSGETPDPMPGYKETGNPISIQFNEYFYPNENIIMTSFKLFKNNKEIKETKILTEETDPNKRFSKYQFALFPINILDKNQEYRVEFKYNYKDIDHTIIWKFKTKK